MDATKTFVAEDVERALETELETWDWARPAGVSADALREVLRASLFTPELRRAA